MFDGVDHLLPTREGNIVGTNSGFRVWNARMLTDCLAGDRDASNAWKTTVTAACWGGGPQRDAIRVH